MGTFRCFIAIAALILAGCGRSTQSAVPPTEDAARIACDRFAARAIQASQPSQAATLSGEAAECYHALEQPPRSNQP